MIHLILISRNKLRFSNRLQSYTKNERCNFGSRYYMANHIYLTFCLFSTGKCKNSDLLKEKIFRRAKIEFFTRSAVNFILYLTNESIGQS